MQPQLQELETLLVPSPLWTISGGELSRYEGSVRVAQYDVLPGWDGTAVLEVAKSGSGDDLIFVGAGPGGSPHVKAFRYDGSTLTQVASFYVYDPLFAGGVRLAYDAQTEQLITGAGPGGGPHVKVLELHGARVDCVNQFMAGDPKGRNGVEVAVNEGVVVTSPSLQNLHSRPGSPTTIYLSFGPNAPASAIPTIWQQVANYYVPYDANVTTVQPSLASHRYATVIVGGTGSPSEGWAEGDLTDSTLGVALTNGYFQSNSFESKPAHAFADRIGWSNTTQIARVIAHESAHLFGLEHSLDPNSIMYEGIRPGRGQWDEISDLILALRLGRV